ncbi:hypothetical protein ASF12_22975 [Paenibacillus sp. Leaf72]|nr:hypothetical protein ASF12_22975 [Paenibacillus sp. Leaf72]
MGDLRKCVECGEKKHKDMMIGNNIWGPHFNEIEHEQFMEYRCADSCFIEAVEHEREQGERI